MLDLRYRSILAMAIPLMGSSFIQSVVLITDSSFLSRYSTVAFDAAGNGGLIYVTMFMALIGMGDGAQILMARRMGQKRQHRLAQIFGTTLLTNLFLVIILFAFLNWIMPSVIHGYSKHSDVATGQIDYISIRSYGLFFGIVSLTINAYFMALGKTLIVFISAIIIAVSNIGLDYLLIFGEGGLPEMGLKGAALASTIADCIGMIFLTISIYLSKSQKEHKLFHGLAYNHESFKEVIRLSTPIMFQGLIALSTWTIFFAWIEQIGKYELTISQNIRSLYFLAFVPIWGLSATTKTYVSQYLGMHKIDQVKVIMRRIQFLTIAFLVLFFHGAMLYPEAMISAINPKTEYIQDSVEILQFITGSVLIYGFGSIYFHAINGTGNTKVTFIIEVISVIIYLITAYFLIKVFKVDLFWIWSVEYIYFASMGLFSFLYLRFFNWQKKQI